MLEFGFYFLFCSLYEGFVFEFTVLFIFILLREQKNEARKLPLLQKLNGSVSNEFGTCCACGTRLLRKLKQSSAVAANAFLCKVLAYFWKVALRSNSYFITFMFWFSVIVLFIIIAKVRCALYLN